MNNPEFEKTHTESINIERPLVQRLMDNWEPLTWMIGGSLVLGGMGVAGGPTWPIHSNPELGLIMVLAGAATIGTVYLTKVIGSAYLEFLRDHHGHH